MSSPVASVTQTPATAQTIASQPKATAAKPQQTPTDTVTISAAGKTALQEAQETRFQTAQEAAKGDSQAKRLLAKETAARVPSK
jgi:hypothetical protein